MLVMATAPGARARPAGSEACTAAKSPLLMAAMTAAFANDAGGTPLIATAKTATAGAAAPMPVGEAVAAATAAGVDEGDGDAPAASAVPAGDGVGDDEAAARQAATSAPRRKGRAQGRMVEPSLVGRASVSASGPVRDNLNIGHRVGSGGLRVKCIPEGRGGAYGLRTIKYKR